jgi:hypothetical protein
VVERVVSGGQTGVDRAALDAALRLGILCGGWCPAGRRAEDGAIPARYPLTETPEPDYAVRTALNVRDSDATLILAIGALSGGTALTRRLAEAQGRPCRVVDLDAPPADDAVRAWLARERVRVLNVAGPRESLRPGIHRRARRYLEAVLSRADPGSRD